jgi:2-polyprenyl-6-methoxyphenol hydroxylase-like FAD-dependent oxidoreductase
MNVGVVGGGIGGLALAVALRRAGIDSFVIERSTAPQPVGGGFVMWSNGMAALAELGLADEVAATGSEIEVFELLSEGGGLLARIPVSEISRSRGRPTVCVRRAAVWEALNRALGDVGVRYGVECIGFAARGSDKASARLAEGESEDVDVLVGADGRESVIRRQLLDDGAPHAAGVVSWSAVIPFEHPLVPRGLMRTHIGRGRQFIFHPCGSGQYYWSAELRQGDDGIPSGAAIDLASFYEGFPEPVASLIGATPANVIVRAEIRYRKPARRWGDGHVTLLGDAAHLMTPNTGQGANQALEDAVVLADQLQRGNDDPVEALRAYEAIRQARTAKVMNAALANTRMLRVANPVAVACRNAFMRLALRRLLTKQVRELATWSPRPQDEKESR